jgi:diadenosine tetraphosphate (Ap4A) HIT family hydrolase
MMTAFAWCLRVLPRAQFVDHVHFHVIPKPSDSEEEGLVVGWPHKTPDKEELAAVQAELVAKL